MEPNIIEPSFEEETNVDVLTSKMLNVENQETFSWLLMVRTAMKSLFSRLRSGPLTLPPGISICSSLTHTLCFLQIWDGYKHISQLSLPQTGLYMPLFNRPRCAAAQTDVEDSFGEESDKLFGWGGAVDDAVFWQNDVLVPAKMHQVRSQEDSLQKTYFSTFSSVW